MLFIFILLSIIFLIISSGIIVKDNKNTINNSFILIGEVLNIDILEYTISNCIIKINNNINMNVLFSFICVKIFNLCVLALKELNTAKNINSVKKDVIK